MRPLGPLLIYFVGRFYFSRGARRRAFRVGPQESLVDPWARVMASPSGALCVGGGRTATTGRCPAASRHTHDPDDLSPPDPPVSPVGLVLSSSLSVYDCTYLFRGEVRVCVLYRVPKDKARAQGCVRARKRALHGDLRSLSVCRYVLASQ